MVPPNSDIVLQNRRINHSETSTINICDVVNIIALQHARVIAAIKMSLRQYFRLLLDYETFGYIPKNEP